MAPFHFLHFFFLRKHEW